MGFKLQQVVVQAGSSEFPTGDTDADRIARSKTLLTKCAQALLDCNVGWVMDTSLSPQTTTYANIPDKTNTNYPGLFFKNTISGCKLFMGYFGGNVYTNGIKDFSGSDVIPVKHYKNHGGLCMSMIPGESTQTFGTPSSTSFIPSHATRICGTYWRETASEIQAGEYYSAAYNPVSGTYYSYSIMATDSTIAIYAFHTTDSSVANLCSTPIYAVGKIFGVISHSPEQPNAYYGVIMPRISSYQYESWCDIGHKSFSPYGTTIDVPWSDIDTQGFTGGSFARADGTWVSGSQAINGYWCNASFYTTDIAMCDNGNTFNLSGSYRWSPIGMMVNTPSTQLATLGVTAGNGFKGYLDTELFGAGIPSTGVHLCDNGNKIYMGTTSQGSWVLGWDSHNPSVPA